MNLYIGITDNSWYTNLKDKSDIDEVNFLQRGGRDD